MVVGIRGRASGRAAIAHKCGAVGARGRVLGCGNQRSMSGDTLPPFKGGLPSLARIGILVQQTAHSHGAAGHNRQRGGNPDVNS